MGNSLSIKLPMDAADDMAPYLGLLPLDRNAPAVTGMPSPNQPSGMLPPVGAVQDTGGGILPPVSGISQMGAPGGPPGSADYASQKLASDTAAYKPWSQLGIGGKIGRIAGYGASAIVPHVAAMIPETPLGHIAELNADTQQLRGAQQEERSQSAEQRAQSAETSEEQARQSIAAYQSAESQKDVAQADVARQQAALTPVTLGNGQTVYVPVGRTRKADWHGCCNARQVRPGKE